MLNVMFCVKRSITGNCQNIFKRLFSQQITLHASKYKIHKIKSSYDGNKKVSEKKVCTKK